MTCVNCHRPAVWMFQTTGVRDTPYCNPHLPAAYRGSKHVTPYFEEPPVEDRLAPVEAVAETPVPAATPKRTRKARAAKSLIEEIDADPERKPLLDAARAELAAETTEA